MSVEELAEKIAEKYREQGRDVRVMVEEKTSKEENRHANEIADRVATVLNRFDDLRQPFRKRREERLKRRGELLDGFFDGLRKGRSHSDTEELERENEELKRRLEKEEKKEEEKRRMERVSGIHSTKDGRDIAIEI